MNSLDNGPKVSDLIGLNLVPQLAIHFDDDGHIRPLFDCTDRLRRIHDNVVDTNSTTNNNP